MGDPGRWQLLVLSSQHWLFCHQKSHRPRVHHHDGSAGSPGSPVSNMVFGVREAKSQGKIKPCAWVDSGRLLARRRCLADDGEIHLWDGVSTSRQKAVGGVRRGFGNCISLGCASRLLCHDHEPSGIILVVRSSWAGGCHCSDLLVVDRCALRGPFHGGCTLEAGVYTAHRSREPGVDLKLSRPHCEVFFMEDAF